MVKDIEYTIVQIQNDDMRKAVFVNVREYFYYL